MKEVSEGFLDQFLERPKKFIFQIYDFEFFVQNNNKSINRFDIKILEYVITSLKYTTESKLLTSIELSRYQISMGVYKTRNSRNYKRIDEALGIWNDLNITKYKSGHKPEKPNGNFKIFKDFSENQENKLSFTFSEEFIDFFVNNNELKRLKEKADIVFKNAFTADLYNLFKEILSGSEIFRVSYEELKKRLKSKIKYPSQLFIRLQSAVNEINDTVKVNYQVEYNKKEKEFSIICESYVEPECEELHTSLIKFIHKKFLTFPKIFDISNDIALQCFVNFYNSKKRHPRKEDKSYLFTAAENLAKRAYNEFKKNRTREKNFEEINEILSYNSDFENIDNEFTQKAFTKTLDLLKPEEKEIIYLRYYAGMRFPEIAQKIQMNANTVRTHHNRALEKIQPQILSLMDYDEKYIKKEQETKADKEIREKLERAKILSILGKLSEAENMIKQIVKEAEEKNDIKTINRSLLSLGRIYISNFKAKLALKIFHQLLNQINQKDNIWVCLEMCC